MHHKYLVMVTEYMPSAKTYPPTPPPLVPRLRKTGKMADELDEDEEDLWDEKSLKQLKRRLQGPRSARGKPSKARRTANLQSGSSSSTQGTFARPKVARKLTTSTGPSKCSTSNGARKRTHDRSSPKKTPENSTITDHRKVPLGYCPKCQMPFSKYTIGGQSPRWHVMECLERQSSPIGRLLGVGGVLVG